MHTFSSEFVGVVNKFVLEEIAGDPTRFGSVELFEDCDIVHELMTSACISSENYCFCRLVD